MALFRNNRKTARVNVDAELTWAIPGQKLSGTGRLIDVSAQGASFRMTQPFNPAGRVVFSLTCAEVPALPKTGRLKWFRRLAGRDQVFVCAVIFDEPASAAWTQWLEKSAQSSTGATT